MLARPRIELFVPKKMHGVTLECWISFIILRYCCLSIEKLTPLILNYFLIIDWLLYLGFEKKESEMLVGNLEIIFNLNNRFTRLLSRTKCFDRDDTTVIANVLIEMNQRHNYGFDEGLTEMTLENK